VHDLVTVPPPLITSSASAAASSREPPPAALTRELPPPHSEAEASPGSSGEAILPLFAEPEGHSFAVLQPGVLFVRTSEDPGRAFAGRLDALRVVSGGATTRVIHRRTGDADTSDVLGGIGSPIVRITGQAACVLGSRSGHRIVLLELDFGLAFVREDRVLAFELSLAYESARLALEHPDERTRPPADGVAIVQLRGTGVVALETRGRLSSVASTATTPLLVRREWIVGWLGRLAARSLPPAEAPGGQRGLVGFSGEGSVLIAVE
jgi:uncharacterized protein (AIM24 family)